MRAFQQLTGGCQIDSVGERLDVIVGEVATEVDEVKSTHDDRLEADPGWAGEAGAGEIAQLLVALWEAESPYGGGAG